MSGRHGGRNFAQAMGAHARRAVSPAWPIWIGVVTSYDPDAHKAVVTFDLGQGKTYPTPPSQICTPFWGTGGSQPYGHQGGPPIGAQAICAVLNPQGNLFAILGFLPNDQDPGSGVPSDDLKITDARGSFVEWTAADSGALNVSGASKATVTAGDNIDISAGTEVDVSAPTVSVEATGTATLSGATTNVEGSTEVDVTAPTINLEGAVNLGGRSLGSGGAVVRKTDLDSALAAQVLLLQTQIATWASGLASGSGAPGPTLTPVTSTGSTTTHSA